MRITDPALKQWLLPGLVLAYLWFTLINHLRIEWAVNPQYSYGLAVPIFCLYLVHLRSQRSDLCGQRRHNFVVNFVANLTEISPIRQSLRQRSAVSGIMRIAVLGVLALGWLPLRLIQEANPEWRLVSWALAITVVSLTLLLLPKPQSESPLAINRSAFVFPLLFFLVAVPWPTIIEGPLIQALTQANASCAIELLNLSGLPALRHGNLIEIGTGVVNIDEACSGIRSFQATLMISLFLGELYRLTVLRRLSLCLAGFALSFVFNVGRTTLLTWVAGRDGIAAIQRWHDPAGGVILVLCFITLWLLALSRRAGGNPIPNPNRSYFPVLPIRAFREIRGQSSFPVLPPSGGESTRISNFTLQISKPAVGLLIWFLLCEISVAAWYRLHESRLPAAAEWTVTWPTNAPSFRELPFSDKTRQYLRYDEGINAGWLGAEGRRWQVIFLRWNPGKIAVHLARTHTPQSCLPASGRQILATSEVRLLDVGGLPLPFRHYVADDGGRQLHVFYCLWEDRGTEQHLQAMSLTLRNRLEPVLAGIRNLGQRSLEVAIWGIQDEQEAEAALIRELKLNTHH